MSSLEIERTYLLDRLPDLPSDADAIRIEQGYLDPAAPGSDDVIREGRIRRIRYADGHAEHIHTIKRGSGLVREEYEEPIEPEAFERAWPRTIGRRIVKTRHRVAEGEFVWEIDDFDDVDIVLAEVELPSAETVAPIPSWLEPRIRREVTEDPTYRNYQIALRVHSTR